MKIGIDCRLSGVAHAGIGRYIENLTKRLPLIAPEVDWVYFYHDKDQVVPSLKVESRLVPIRHYSLQEQLRLAPIFKKENLDLLHVPHFNVPIGYSGHLIVTIHDLLWHQQRGAQVTTLKPWKYWMKYFGYRLVAARAIDKAEKILVPTQTISDTLGDFYPNSIDKIIVTKEGVDEQLLQHKNKKISKKKKTLIYVGSLYPHKNIKLIIESLQKLTDWKLTIVGSRNVFQDQIKDLAKKFKVEKKVKFAGYLKDQSLAKEIMSSTALVQPSLSEGFGLTGIEALSLKTPVLASNIPVFKEIYQDAAIYFDPHSVESFLLAIDSLAKNKTQLKQASSVVSQYNWDKMAQKTMSAYRSILSK
jgi:glycosyltransferase involved in cell wall biosynthesis